MRLRSYIAIAALLLLASCTPKHALMITKDKDGSRMIVGTAQRSMLHDAAFSWFDRGYSAYKPTTAPLAVIRGQAPTLHIEVFGGTWCDDTHDLLPRFYKVADATGISDAQVTLHLVGRDKKTKDGSADRYHITNVPTFVVIKAGKEIGRITESVKKSMEADLAEILTDKD
ncbi:MAG: thioredoxin family protein [Bacteroidetes bacterium]|nr:thioredoxin family protein [Bacteroidota bacterium]